MARNRNFKTYVGDFETTVFDGQEHTEVWASALVETYTEDVKIFHSIQAQWDYIVKLNQNMIIYYHNLSFDGSFWLSFFLDDLKFKHAFNYADEEEQIYDWKREYEMRNRELKYTISNMGQWYVLQVKYKNKIIEFRDSLKLLPYSVERIGKTFGTQHMKTNIQYKGFRYAGCPITDLEKEYIKNDVLVIKEALEIMFDEGHNKLTIGSCCLAEFKTTISDQTYSLALPDLTEHLINPQVFNYENADKYIRRSYRGGWCYVVPEKAKKIYRNGVTLDVNSLYPSMMHSSSGNRYPVGRPTFWTGNYIPNEALTDNRYFFVRLKTNFYIKDNMLPFVQIKGNPMYKGNDMLTTSELFSEGRGCYYKEFLNDSTGKVQSTAQTLTLTMTDYEMLLEHYYLEDFEILDGCYFETTIGLFDDYINKYAEIKKKSKGAKREEAKLFLNNLYGKMATNTDSSFKVAYLNEEKELRFYTINESNKKSGYIAIGSAITSYARAFTIKVAQQNYYGTESAGFIYADTDSIHVDIPFEKIKGVKIHPTEFSCWSIDAVWTEGYFARQKTYIERVVSVEDLPENQKHAVDYHYDNDKTYTDIKGAGLPKKANNILKMAIDRTPLTEELIKEWELSDETVQWIQDGKKIEDYQTGLYIPQGNLKGKQVRGGVLLIDKPYIMR